MTKALNDLDTLRGAGAARLKTASLAQIESDPQLQTYALQVGTSIFGDNCATCHGAGGGGGKGYPNLRDDVWLWGGTLEDIQQTITYGIRSGDDQARMSQMPAFGRDGMLQAPQIADLTEYVVSLSGRPGRSGGRGASHAGVRRATASAATAPPARGPRRSARRTSPTATGSMGRTAPRFPARSRTVAAA